MPRLIPENPPTISDHRFANFAPIRVLIRRPHKVLDIASDNAQASVVISNYKITLSSSLTGKLVCLTPKYSISALISFGFGSACPTPLK